jgi:ribosomal protein S18 acetylase RimI-like enzyme
MSLDSYGVRAASLNDCEAIARYNVAMAMETEHKTLDDTTVLSGVRSLMNQPGAGFYLVAENFEEVVGCLLVTFEWSDWRDGNFWWIQSVYVAPSHRRHGVFRQLYDCVMRKARKQGNVCGVRLYVERDNLTAQATYRQLGMVETAYRIFEHELP